MRSDHYLFYVLDVTFESRVNFVDKRNFLKLPSPLACIRPFLGDDSHVILTLYEPRCEKTGLRGFLQGPTQIGLYSHRIW